MSGMAVPSAWGPVHCTTARMAGQRHYFTYRTHTWLAEAPRFRNV